MAIELAQSNQENAKARSDQVKSSIDAIALGVRYRRAFGFSILSVGSYDLLTLGRRSRPPLDSCVLYQCCCCSNCSWQPPCRAEVSRERASTPKSWKMPAVELRKYYSTIIFETDCNIVTARCAVQRLSTVIVVQYVKQPKGPRGWLPGFKFADAYDTSLLLYRNAYFGACHRHACIGRRPGS